MKIAVTAAQAELDAQIDPRFGRCPWFMIIDTETLEFEAVENPNLALGGGTGIQSAGMMADKGVTCVLAGNCGRCEYKGACGGCRARAFAATGEWTAADPMCAYRPPVG